MGKRGPETERSPTARHASGLIALCGDTRSMPALRPRLTRALARAPAAAWHRRTRSVRAGGCWCRDDACGGDRGGPGLAPRAELLMVSEAHLVAIPRGLKVQAPEPDFEPGVGDSPRGPLKQRGNPHLNPTTRPKHNLPNYAGNSPRCRDSDGPSRRPS
jgi:hypothetical protein